MKIYILGLGNMGCWFASRLSKEHEVLGFDRDKKKIGLVESQIGILPPDDLKSFRPDLVLNAVSLKETIRAFQEIERYVEKETIFSDIASIKGDIPEYYRRKKVRYLSMHPMFGPTFANMEKLEGENVIFISGSDKEAVEVFKRFFMRFKVKFFELTFDEHDRMMAYSLTVPFVSSLVFASCVEKKIVPGTTFAKHLTIAKGLLSEDDHLLAEILFNPSSLPELEKITGRLEYLKHIVKQKDYEELSGFLFRLRRNLI
ncbi:MAG: prephenate dehydrogenase/arogenate dehydrogenase family protein [Deltaproteobacteria bacterium]|nr:prephenate dehydrogenase/arogenate dehydrogenase family protein [Deltaproteobacteria bacterium]